MTLLKTHFLRPWLAGFLAACLILTSLGLTAADKASAAPSSFLYPINQEARINQPSNPLRTTLTLSSDDLPEPGDSVHLLIYAHDVDEDQGEWDEVTWNGVHLGGGVQGVGILTGMNNEDSTTVFELNPASLRESNDLQIEVTRGLGSTTAWVVTVHWAQIVIAKGPREDAEIARLAPAVTAPGTITVPVDTRALQAGSYLLEANLVDANGNNYGLISERYIGANVDELFTTSFDITGLAPGIYTANAIVYEYNGVATGKVLPEHIGRVQHLVSATIDTRNVLEGLSFAPVDGAAPIALSPSPFNPYTTGYTASVPFGTSELTPAPVLPETLPAGTVLELQVNGGGYARVENPAEPDAIQLQVGRNVIQYKVSSPQAPDGQVYTITVDRAPKLVDLGSSPELQLTPDFDGDTPVPAPAAGYHAAVGNPVDRIVLTPELPEDEGLGPEHVTVSVNGGAFEPLADGTLQTEELPLEVGRNYITVRVTSPDGHVQTDYPIIVDRAPALSAPGFSSGDDELAPEFDSGTYDYTIVVGHTETPITLTPEVNDGETIEIRVNSDDEADFVPAANDEETGDLDLIAGTNIIEVRVKSPDYDGALSDVPADEKEDLVRTYTFTVIRSPYLTDLVVHDEELTEVFDPAGTSYATDGTVPYSQSSVKVTPTTSDAPVKLEIRVNGGEFVEINSGEQSADLPLNSGANTIEVKATSINPLDESEYTTVYTVVVNRAYPPYVPVIPTGPVSELDAGLDDNGQRVLITDIIGKELNLWAHLVKPDGEKLDRPEFRIDADGKFALNNIPAGDYSLVATVNGPTGEKLAGTVNAIEVAADGSAKADGKLIDPRSKVTNIVTGESLEGVQITLYWADTELNRSKGRVPGEAVKLPALNNFAPHKNAAAQTTAGDGVFGWVPPVDGDYYFIAEKEGYNSFDSRQDGRNVQFEAGTAIRNGIIHVGNAVFVYNFAMTPEGAELEIGTHEPYMNGYPDGEFKPERGISRAELAAVLSRIIPVDDSVALTVPELSDLAVPFWASGSIHTALEQGWLKGYTDGTFKSARFVTRAELAQVVYNIKSSEWASNGSTVSFNDTQGHWAAAAIAAVVGQGLIDGDANGNFRPNEAVTRAEAVTLFNHLLDRSPVRVSATPRWSDVPATYWAYKDIMEASVAHEYIKVEGEESWTAE